MNESPVSPAPNGISFDSLQEQINASEFRQRVLVDRNEDLRLLEVVSNEHGTITVHEHLKGTSSEGFYISALLRGCQPEFWKEVFRPGAFAIDDHRYAHSLGGSVYVQDFRTKKHLAVHHNLIGKVLTLAFREGNRLLISDANGCIFAPIFEID